MTAAAASGEDGGARLIFRAGAMRYALAASRVRELARLPRLTRVPLAPPGLLGLGQVRGETLAILSPHVLDPDSAASDPRQILVLDGAERIGLAIDMVERVDRTIDDTIVDLPLDTLIRAVSPPRPAARRTATSAVRRTATHARDERLALLHFAIGDQAFALPLHEIVEVVKVPGAIARLPDADTAVVGTILWRDTTLGLLSSAALLGLAAGAVADNARRIVILALGSHRLGLLVDRVEGLLRADPERIDPVPPSLLRSEAEARIRAIYRPAGGGRLVSILAGDQLASEARNRRLLANDERPIQRDAVVTRIDERRLLVAVMGKHRLGLPLDAIERVAPPPRRITPIPNGPDWLVGIAAVGGEPLMIVDQVRRLTGQPADSPHQRLLVVRLGGRRLGFLVEDARSIVDAGGPALAPAPLPKDLASGIYGDALQLDGDVPLLVVEPVMLMSSAEQALVESYAAA